MTRPPKRDLLGVMIDPVDYASATEAILEAATEGRRFGVSALAVHGVMECVADPELRYRVNNLELVTPDGQAVRWAVDLLHGTGMTDRCYGPTLMRWVCRAAAGRDLPVYLYGSTPEVLEPLETGLRDLAPGLQIAGTAPSTFGRVSPAEMDAIAGRIRSSGARIVFAGLGCPRQEIFAYEMARRLDLPVLAVGAAFDYHAGLLDEPPAIIQRAGLQWFWRLCQEPARLWRRYATTNPAFVLGVLRQRSGRWRATADTAVEPSAELGYS